MGRSRIATGGETELMGKRDLRIYALLDTLKESPVLSIKELADRFQVSEMTIRRDIDYLKENRLFYENKASEPAAREHDEYLYSSEQIRNFDKKDRIARFAAGMIEEGDILILDSGTTTGVLSKYIPEQTQLTVLCYNYHILSQLQGNEKLSLIFASVAVSTALVLSSRIRIFGCFKRALAIHNRCFWPPDTLTPPWPSWV